MVRAFASQSIDWGFISQVESCQKIFKMLLTASSLGAQQNMDSMENKPANLLVVFLGKTLNKKPLRVCGRAKQSTRRGGSSLTEDSQTERKH